MSIAAFVDELDRAHALGLLGVVIHPGRARPGPKMTRSASIADAIRAAFKRTAAPHRRWCCSSTRQGRAGRSGYRFEHLAAIIDHLDGSPRVGVCLDTCHLVASGYDITSSNGYDETFEAFDRLVGRRSPAGLSRQRLEAAVRQPRRSARAHRRRLPRARAVPSAAPRPAICRFAVADRNRKDDGQR